MPTPAPSFEPTHIAGNPTASPTEVVIASLMVNQRVRGLSPSEAQSDEFKFAMKESLAERGKFKSSNCKVVKVTAFSLRRSVLEIGADIEYIITEPNGNAEEITSALSSSATDGSLNESLQLYGFITADVGAPSILDVSPTAFPTYSPVGSRNTRSSETIVMGACLGSVALLFLFAVTIHCIRRNSRGYGPRKARMVHLVGSSPSKPASITHL